MEWMIETLRVLREIRDWSDRRVANGERSAATRDAIHRAVAVAEAEANDAIVVERMGPAREKNEKPKRPQSGKPRIPSRMIDRNAQTVVRRLQRAGFKGYLVGGCVRDLLLGLEPKDFDIATDARPEDVKRIFKRNSRIIGRRFRLVHVHFGRNQILEVSTFRANITDEEAGEDQDLLIRRDNVFGSEEEDAQRRDFTINGLFYDVTTGQIIDHVDGLADIDRRYLRMIGDPEIRLREDPVRILRAIRFKAKTNLVIDDDLFAAMIAHKEDLRRCAPARILEESLRLLRIGFAQETVRLLAETGVLEILFPMVQTFIEDPEPITVIGPDGERTYDRLPYILRHLEALDDIIARGEDVDDAVALAALFCAPLMERLEDPEVNPGERSRMLSELIREAGAPITLTKRLHESIRQMFLAQRRLSRKGGRRKRSRGRVTDSGLQFLEIYLRANERSLEPLERAQR